MFVPEFLYQLSARDQQVTWLDPVLRRIASTQAAANITVDFPVPSDRALLLTSAHITADAGAAQTVNEFELELLVLGTTPLPPILNRSDEVSAVAATVNLTWQGEVLVPPSWSVRANAIFSGGAAANGVELSILGVLIPVGNIQRV